MQNKGIIAILLATAGILLVPLVAMQFTDEVVWGPGDFIFAAVILAGTGLTYRLVVTKTGNLSYRIAAAVALGAAFILVWGNLAVGLIGSEDEPVNMLYFIVLIVGLIGAAIGRFRPEGMARALLAAALAQTVITGIALIAGAHNYPESSVADIVRVNAFFVALFVLSALLFQHAGATGSTWNRRLEY